MPDFYREGRSVADVQTSILGRVSMLENRPDIRARFLQHDDDYKLWRLEKYTLEEVTTFAQNAAEWPSATLNGPRTLWNAVRRSVTANPPRFRIALPGLTINPNDSENFAYVLGETSRHERFARGLFQSMDEQRIRRGQQLFQLQLAFYVAIRGGAFARVWFDPDRKIYPFSVALWDPRTVVYEGGLDSLSFACHHYRAPLYDIRESWPDVAGIDGLQADQDGNVEVYDAWWLQDGKAYNCVFTTSLTLKPSTEVPKLDHLPVFMVRMAGPDIEALWDQMGDTKPVLDAWESIYATNKTTYPWMNRIATLYGLYLRDAAIGSRVASGTGLPNDPAQVEKALKPFKVLIGQNIDVKTVAPPSMAAEAKEFFAFLQGEEQRGGVPYSTFGTTQFQLSGFAINQLQGALSIMTQPVQQAMEWMYRLCADEAIQQFRQRGKRTLEIRGMDQRRQQFIEQIKRSDIRDKYYMEVEILPESPVDELQRAQIGEAWKSMGIDPITIMDEVLHIDDPRQVLNRSLAWQMLQQLLLAPVAPPQAAAPPKGVGAGVPGEMAPVPPEMMGEPAGQGMQEGDFGRRRLNTGGGGGY
jgi:hypothetical protein